MISKGRSFEQIIEEQVQRWKLMQILFYLRKVV